MEQSPKHPNFFDIVFIVLILALAAGAYWVSHDSTRDKDLVSRSYVIELDHIQEDMVQYAAPGDSVTDNVKNQAMGTVTAVEVVPCTVSVTDEATGTIKQVPVEGYVSLLLTVQADTTETDSQIATKDGYVLRVGTSVSCSVGALTSAGYILSVDR
mgnify:FL=1